MDEANDTMKQKTKPQQTVRYPHVITQDDDGKLVAYSRGCVSWEPEEKQDARD